LETDLLLNSFLLLVTTEELDVDMVGFDDIEVICSGRFITGKLC
jgi:hypothetical protein